MEVEVNGQHVGTLTVDSNDWKQPLTAKIDVNLKKGRNTIRLYNASAWMPDIDRMEIK